MTLPQLLVALTVLILALVLWPVAHSLGPLNVKPRARVGLYDALEQAESNLIDNTRPVAIYKQDRKEPIAVFICQRFPGVNLMSEQADEEMSFPIEILTIR
jgi:hypothetical protein